MRRHARELDDPRRERRPGGGPARRQARADLTFQLAYELLDAKDLPGAEALFVRAASLARDNATIQAWTGRFFLKAESKPKEALEYDYRACFLDPDDYETEFVESRIARYARDDIAKCP